MSDKLKIFFCFFLVLILLFPTFVKLEHNHHHFSCLSKTEKHIHQGHDRCSICSFEYSVFIYGNLSVSAAEGKFVDIYSNIYKSSVYFNDFKYNFLLRAPPEA